WGYLWGELTLPFTPAGALVLVGAMAAGAGPASTAPCEVGTPVLHSTAVAPKQLGSPELQELAVVLAAGLWCRLCLGPRAPQLGVPLQVFATKLPPAKCQQYLAVLHCAKPFPLHLLINPTLCGRASLRGFSAYIPHHWAVHVSRGVDEHREPHELDHLDVILFLDRMDTCAFTNIGWMELLD
uniref:Mannosyltransferase n=1 Tax=Strigops habroptila TaxID=2489341 RepID=A0A672TH03_STRHB